MTAESFIEVTPNKDGITADLLVRLPEEVNQQEGGVTLFEVEPQEVLDTVSPNNLSHLLKVLEDIEGEGGVVDSDLAKEFKKEVQFALDSTPFGSDNRVMFSLGGHYFVYGDPGYFPSVTIANNATETHEVSSIRSLFVFTVDDRDKRRALKEIVNEASKYGILISPALRPFVMNAETRLEVLEQTAKKARDIGLDLPEEFPSGRELKPHQVSGALTLAYNNGGLLADQVGLGKGGEFINAWETSKAWLKERGHDVGPVVVTVKKTLLPEMVKEIQLWVDDPNIVVLQGRKDSHIPKDTDYILLNYDILAARADQLKALKPSGFISDESHVYKNEKSKRSQAANDLSVSIFDNNEHPFVLLASGTPFVNSPRELYSVLSILGVEKVFTDYAMERVPDKTEIWWFDRRSHRYRSKMVKMSPLRAFETYFCGGYNDRYRKWRNDGATNIEELNQLLVEEAGMVRRRKSDVISPLPPVSENAIEVKLSGEYQELYQTVEDEFYNFYIEMAREIAREEGISERQAIQVAHRKLENAEWPMRFGKLRQVTSQGKANYAIDWIDKFLSGDVEVTHGDGSVGPVSDDPTRKKLIVFVHYRDSRAAILESPVLAKYNPVAILPGDEQTGEEIQKAKELFQQDNDDHRLIVCSMAAREGHTLTAAKDIAIVDIPFSPDWVVQMIGRAWARISEYEPHEAYAHYFVAPNTVDEQTLNRTRLRKVTFDAVIDLEGTEEDIREVEESVDSDVMQDILEGVMRAGIGT